MHGKLVDVSTRDVGGEVTASSVGTVVQLRDAVAFDESGGWADLFGDVFEYVSADLEADTITLAAPLAVEEGDWIDMWPSRQNTTATVRLDEDDEPVEAGVPLGMMKRIPEGTREDLETAETVLVDWVDDGLQVVDVVGDDGHIKTEWQINSGGAFIAGDPDGDRTELNSSGVYVYRLGPNGLPYSTTSLTSFETAINVMDQSGAILGGFNNLGDVSGRNVTVNREAVIRGRPLLGQLGGGDVPGWLDFLPRGIIAPRTQSSDGSTVPTDTEQRGPSVSANLLPGRQYRVVSWLTARTGAVDGVIRTRIRRAVNQYPPLGSPLVGPVFTGQKAYSASVTSTYRNEGLITVQVPTKMRFVVTYEGLNGATPTRTGEATIYVEDVGPVLADSGSDEGDTNPTTRYQSTWRATASRVYDKDGAAIPGSDGKADLWYWFASPTAFESVAVLFGGATTESEDAVEIGKTLPQALNGATIHRAEIYLHNKSWYDDDEGHTALAALGAASLPAPEVSKVIDGNLYVPAFPAGTGVWVDVPVSWFTNGVNRGVTIGDKDGYTLNGANQSVPLTSGAMHGVDDPNPPLVRITYSR